MIHGPFHHQVLVVEVIAEVQDRRGGAALALWADHLVAVTLSNVLGELQGGDFPVLVCVCLFLPDTLLEEVAEVAASHKLFRDSREHIFL